MENQRCWHGRLVCTGCYKPRCMLGACEPQSCQGPEAPTVLSQRQRSALRCAGCAELCECPLLDFASAPRWREPAIVCFAKRGSAACLSQGALFDDFRSGLEKPGLSRDSASYWKRQTHPLGPIDMRNPAKLGMSRELRGPSILPKV